MVCSRQERSGEYFSKIYADEFRETLVRLELLDFPLMGGK